MNRQVVVFVALMFSASACAQATLTPAPAPQPTAAPVATTAPFQPPAETHPTVQPTQGLPELRPPISGGKLNPPTPSLTAPGARPNTAAGRGWQSITALVAPPARYDHALVFVADVNRVVLFGGRSKSVLDDTWVYDLVANAWHAVSSRPAPDARFGAGAAYDAANRRVILFGGQAAKFFNDTWAFDPVTEQWARIAALGALLSPRSGLALAIDPVNARLIASQGLGGAGRFDDTRVLNLKTNVGQSVSPAVRPGGRAWPAAAFDLRANALIMFGGQDAQGHLLSDVWRFDSTTQLWSAVNSTGAQPAARSNSTLSYNPADGLLYLFGGKTAQGVNNELWSLELATGIWTPLKFSGGPLARSHHMAVWDTLNQRLIIFGGQDVQGNALNDLWTYTP